MHPPARSRRAPIAMFGVVALLALITVAAWIGPQVAVFLPTGRWPALGYWQAQGALLRALSGHHPTQAYPRALRAALPAPWVFWTVQGLLTAAILAALAAGVRELDIRASRPVADRRWWQLRGLRPRAVARPRTVTELLTREPHPDRIIIGRYGRPSRLLAVGANVQTLVVAAPRSGKTSGVIIPALLEHDGPVVTTTVRTDVLNHTVEHRRKLGRVWVWDPFGERTDSWDPLQGCEDWEHALLVARWLGHAVSLGASNSQHYFDQEAEGLTAPLLHAAARDRKHQHTIIDVYRWILTRDQQTPKDILSNSKAQDALERLTNVYKYTARQRDGIIGTAAVQLKAYGHPAAARTANPKDSLTPPALFAQGQRNTLYIVAGREHQQLLAPLVVTLISSLLHHLAQTENAQGAGLWPPALFALDETANIAPLKDLPQILATSLPSARFITVWHSIAQIRRHYGPDTAAELLALSQAKIFLGSITDGHTVTELTRLIGPRTTPAHDQHPDVLTAQALQRTTAGEGLLIHTDQPPVFYRQRRYYDDPALRGARRARRGDSRS